MIFSRRCKRCGKYSRQVKVWRMPLSDYLTWQTWRCIDEEACAARRAAQREKEEAA